MKKDYWIIRSKKYNELEWVKDTYLLDQLIQFCDLKKTDIVHEVGCGTGIVSQAIVSKVKQVVASDNALEMIAQLHTKKKILTMCMDLESDIPFTNDFDKIIARMVFHHITDLDKVAKKCHNMLRHGGYLIIQEGIPPSEDRKIVNWYSKVMAIKEKRNTFTETGMHLFLSLAGFRNIESKVIIDKNFSVRNWLESSGQSEEIIEKVYELHRKAPYYIKKAYNMQVKKDDILIDTKILLIKGLVI